MIVYKVEMVGSWLKNENFVSRLGRFGNEVHELGRCCRETGKV